MKAREKAVVVVLVILGVVGIALTRPAECFNSQTHAPYCVD